MEIITIEGRTYAAMMERFETFVRRVEELCDSHGSKTLGEWLDGQEICMILDISKRTLQSLRASAKLPYSMIERKAYYKVSDVERLIKEGEGVSNG